MMQKHGFDQTLGGHIYRAFQRYPDNAALWVDHKTLTYNDVLSQAQAIAAAMQAFDQGIGQVAICSYRSSCAYISILATLLAGKTYVPLNPKFPVYRNQKIIRQARANVFCIDHRCANLAGDWVSEVSSPSLMVFPDHDELPKWCADHPQHTYLAAGDLAEAASWIPPEEINSEDLAYLLFTSGTTGEPKGIGISHRNILTYLGHFREKWPLQQDDRCSQIYDQTFDLSVHDIFGCWQAGACLYVVPETALLSPIDFAHAHKLTTWGSVPSLLSFIKRFGKLTPGALPYIRYSFFCGESLPTDSVKAWAEVCPNGHIINLFGPTETTIAITSYEWNPEEASGTAVMPIGHPFKGQETLVVDDKGNPVQPGETGHLLLAGDQIFQGYWKDKTKTDEKILHRRFEDRGATRWYNTGDLVSEDPVLGLIFHGRQDFQVKINGYRVELEELSSVLRKKYPCNWVSSIPWPVNKTTGTASGIVVWMSGNNSIEEQHIKHYCATVLPPYMTPSRVFWTDVLPRNSNGKVDISALQHMTEARMGPP